MDLQAIPGVGEKTAAALSELADPERALREGDVAAIAAAPGISEGRAARIARGAVRHRHDDPGDFLATDRAREIYRSVLSLLQARAVTDYGEKRLETFYPSPTASRVAEVRDFVAGALDRDPEPGVREALAGVEPLSTPDDVRVRDRCLATTDAERYAAAREAVPELPVEVVDDARELAELARGYSTVIAIDEAFAGVAVEGDVRVEPDALDRPDEVVPERPLAFFAENRERLRAAAAAARHADLDVDVDPDRLEAGLDRLAADGTPTGDEELARLREAAADVDAAVSTAESVANDRLREAIRDRDVTIEGADLLSLVERGAGVDSLLQRELADEFADAVGAARDHLADALRLRPEEAAIAERAFPEDPTFPVEADDDAVARLREELAAARDRRATRLKRELAADLADLRGPAERLVRAALELDVELAVARFARDFDCTTPEFVGPDVAAAGGAAADGERPTPEGTGAGDDRPAPGGVGASPGGDRRGAGGFAVESGRCPLLDVPFEAVDPVDYAVDGVAVLSGVNSGGKTSTLDLVAVVVVLAHMGLPVPADRVRLRRFRRLHYHAKTQGTLDAGAFESTVREFADVAEGGDGLVLVDELESITEPGASAVIIAGILEALHENGATAVFVSHLAGDVRAACEFPVTVDGIEAEGLVDGELRVNRSPVKNHLARSTPELIVEKLAEERGGEFYGRLLEKFDERGRSGGGDRTGAGGDRGEADGDGRSADGGPGDGD